MSSYEVFYGLAFYGLAALTLGGALGMVVTSDMVRAALLVVASLGGVAATYLLLSADFLAIVQLLVYVGAIMVLMLFAVMLTPGHVELPALASSGQRGLALVVATAFALIAVVVLLSTPWQFGDAPLDQPTTELIGQQLFSTYVLPFEIASVLLTAAMIGAIIIARED
jgi:NADH:ubiquinone oxidoreductase subunit 6 (subunit J)